MDSAQFKEALTLLFGSNDKSKTILDLFESTTNFKIELKKHTNEFIDQVIEIFSQVKPSHSYSDQDLLQLSKDARLLDNSFEDLFEQYIDLDNPPEKYKGLVQFFDLIKLKRPVAADYARHSISCYLMGLSNAGRSFIELCTLEVMYDDAVLGDVIEQALKIEYQKAHASKSAKKGNEKRWKASKETKEHAILLYKESNFKNPNQATDKLTDKVIEFGISVGFRFSSNFQASKTIYRWLLESN